MNKKKIIMILILVFILVLGGSGILYRQLGQKLVPDLLVTQAPQENASTDSSAPTTQKDESEKILAPDFTVYDPGGNEVHLSDFIGKPVILNFWASWCGVASTAARTIFVQKHRAKSTIQTTKGQ